MHVERAEVLPRAMQSREQADRSACGYLQGKSGAGVDVIALPQQHAAGLLQQGCGVALSAGARR